MAKKATAVAKRRSSSSAVAEKLPSYLSDYNGPKGTEGIQSEDISVPRLKIGQSMTPQVKEGVVADGDLFINVTGRKVWSPGDPPLPAIIIAQSKEIILWRDQLDSGGGVLARAKPERQEDGSVRYRWDKPNQKFENKIGGKSKVVWETKTYVDENGLNTWGSEIPGDKDSGIAATDHHNYLVILPTVDHVLVALSLSRTGVKIAKNLNAALKMGSAPMWSRVWHLSTVDETSDDFKYKNLKIDPAGYIPEDDEDLRAVSEALFKEYNRQHFLVDQNS